MAACGFPDSTLVETTAALLVIAPELMVPAKVADEFDKLSVKMSLDALGLLVFPKNSPFALLAM